MECVNCIHNLWTPEVIQYGEHGEGLEGHGLWMQHYYCLVSCSIDQLYTLCCYVPAQAVQCLTSKLLLSI